MKNVPLTSAIISALLAFPAYGELKVTGDVDVSTTVITTTTNTGATGAKDLTRNQNLGQGGDASITFKGVHKAGDNYIEGAGSMDVEYSNDGTTSEMKDIYVKLGNSKMNFQIGRFEAMGVYGWGQDTVAENTSLAGIYEVNYARGRSPGQMAFTYLGQEGMKFGLGIYHGTEAGNDDYTKANVFGFRPTFDVAAGPVQIVGAFEQVTKKPQYEKDVNELSNKGETTKTGFGLCVKGTFGPAELGVTYTSGETKGKTWGTAATTDAQGNAVAATEGGADVPKKTEQAMGLYATIANVGPGSLGLGYHLATVTTDATNKIEAKGNLLYASYSMAVLEVGTVALGFSMADAKKTTDGNNVEPTEKVQAVKVKFATTL